MNKCTLFKVFLQVSYPGGEKSKVHFWAYHFNELLAQKAALRWSQKEFENSLTSEVIRVDTIK